MKHRAKYRLEVVVQKLPMDYISVTVAVIAVVAAAVEMLRLFVADVATPLHSSRR